LLQLTRGLLFIVFNWVLFLHFTPIGNGPSIDVMALAPIFNFFLLGFADLFMARKMWKRSINAWRYGILVSVYSIFIALLGLQSVIISGRIDEGILLEIAGVFSAAEILTLATSGARRFHGVTRTS
jgi:hypothetical protein